jgi:hypothetical protein
MGGRMKVQAEVLDGRHRYENDKWEKDSQCEDVSSMGKALRCEDMLLTGKSFTL